MEFKVPPIKFATLPYGYHKRIRCYLIYGIKS